MRGITKNNKHSYNDFEMILLERLIEYPKKRKIKQSIPFVNGEYDFSEIYGSQSYEERNLKYKFGISANSMEQLIFKKSSIINWLYDGNKNKLIDDSEKGYYFLAEIEGEISEKIYPNYAEVTVKFIAYPFKISTLQDGHDIWDEFNFELDMIQDTEFAINGTQTIKLYNNGSIGINPTIVCSSGMQIKKGSITYEFKQGTSKSFSFKLDKGLNELTITGNGTIEFQWCKELL